MTKEQIILEVEELETRLRKLREQVQYMDTIPTSNVSESEIKVMSCEINTVIARNLRGLGIPTNIKGYRYLKTAIKLLVEGTIHPTFRITKELYPEIAKLYETTAQQVERTIRHAIVVGYAQGDLKLWEKVFGHSVSYHEGRPTNLKFVSTLAEYIIENM